MVLETCFLADFVCLAPDTCLSLELCDRDFDLWCDDCIEYKMGEGGLQSHRLLASENMPAFAEKYPILRWPLTIRVRVQVKLPDLDCLVTFDQLSPHAGHHLGYPWLSHESVVVVSMFLLRSAVETALAAKPDCIYFLLLFCFADVMLGQTMFLGFTVVG